MGGTPDAHPTRPRMRPRFELFFSGDVDALRSRLEQDFAASTLYEGKVFQQSAAVWLPEKDRTYWSPYLNLSFEADTQDSGRTHVFGRFSPHPSVWTLFVAIYFALGLIGVGCAVYGMVELSMHGTGWWLLGLPVSLAAIAFVFGASLIGQGLSADQMHGLRHIVEHACGVSQALDPLHPEEDAREAGA